MKVDITKYSIVRSDGLWLIGIIERDMLKCALEIQCQGQIEAGQIKLRYGAAAIFGMAEADEYPVPGATAWAVKDMPESRQKHLADIVSSAEEIRRQMNMQAGTSLHLATSLSGIRPPNGAKA